ncbi:ABC transporter ATP-binding protein [Paenibacillus cremeus]|nr:ATP-binding cassette domain-containing protein [Paenibacillus cremeus]
MIKAESFSFWYPDEVQPALEEVSFHVNEGEFVVICGASGCGKTTLLRHLKPGITPVGTRSGSLHYSGVPFDSLSARLGAEQIGIVFQNPENQIVMDTVWHELAFSMENMGCELTVMRKRLAEMAHFFGLEPLLYKSVHELSGGQKQLINLASVLLLQPKVLLLDEPTSQLDPVAAREFVQLVHRLNQEMSMTVIMSEHRLEDVMPLADRVIVMEQGRVKYNGSPKEIARQIGVELRSEELDYLPSVTQLYLSLPTEEPRSLERIPLTVREGKQWLTQSGWPARLKPCAEPAKQSQYPDSEIILTCREVTYQYEKGAPEVLKKLSLAVFEQECLAIVGGNGAGKSTLLQVMAGLLEPQRGKVMSKLKGKIGYLAQNPLVYFNSDTVEEELRQIARYAGLQEPDAEINSLLRTLQLEETLLKHPHDLSGGQQQKAALAGVLLQRPVLLILDEPTKGLDPAAKKQMAALLRKLREAGMTIVMVTHDVEFAACHATRCAMLFDGAITAAGAPSLFFSENYFYTTAMNRTLREWLPGVLTLEEALQQCKEHPACSS